MTSPSDNAKLIFMSAIEKYSTDQWPAFLDGACGDNGELRGRVEELLRAHIDMGSIHASGHALTLDQLPTEVPGTQIGPYKLLQEVGQGGMGVVYMAQQLEPVRRKVALKIIKPGMDTRQVIARFEAERQALSLMDHPNIAKVLDARTTESGRPYFVMELVHGKPITDYCDEHHLTPRQRLELLVPVCQAIQHAHQKGIIHRDIKPTNVLVAEYDQQPVPKVIDFGVAKATSQPLTEKTMFTGYGQIVGTLEYMSPEQAKVNQLDLDTRSDIYSMGVLLYELLTGSTPFDKQRLRSAAWDEMLRIIREEEPPKPSTRLSQSNESLPSISAQRQTEPAKLTRLVQGELDWIVMKAMEKDRNRRYETASEFAMDLQRYLADEPVEAGPPSVAYRFRKLVQRNRASVFILGLLLLVVLGGLAGTTAGMLRANRERDRKDLALAGEAKSRQEATRAAQLAMRSLQRLTDDVIGQRLARHVVLTEQDRRFLLKIIDDHEELATLRGTGEECQAIRADGLLRVGTLKKQLGQSSEALASIEKAIALYSRLVTDRPGQSAYRSSLAASQVERGSLLREAGNNAEAELDFRRAIETQQQLAEEMPTEPSYRVELVESLTHLAEHFEAIGNFPKAETELSKAVGIATRLAEDMPRDPDHRWRLATVYMNSGALKSKRGHHAEAGAEFRRGIALQTQQVAEFPDEPTYREHLATSHANLGIHLAEAGKPAEAKAETVEAVGIARQLAGDYPLVPRYREQLAAWHYLLAARMAEQGEWDESVGEYRTAITLQQQLASEFPRNPQYRFQVSASRTGVAVVLMELRKFQDAETESRQAMNLLDQLVNDFPKMPDFRQDLAGCHLQMGALLAATGKPIEAEAEYHLAISIAEPLYSEFPEVPMYATYIARANMNLGNLRARAGMLEQAIPFFGRAIEIVAPIVEQGTGMGPLAQDLYSSYVKRATALTQLNRFQEAIADYDRVVELCDEPNRPTIRLSRAACLAHTDPAKGVGEIEDLLAAADRPLEFLYAAACVCSVASANSEQPEHDRFAARAVELLQQARGSGLFRVAHWIEQIKQDTDLAPLRQREDYQKLLAAVEADLKQSRD